jgi:mono/diheme cytochrome c family protein
MRFPDRGSQSHLSVRKSLRLIARYSLLFVAISLTPIAQADDKTTQAEYTKLARPFVAAHCLECHGEEAPEGGFRLDNLAAQFSGRQHAQWLKVLKKLKANEMPPKGQPRPKPAEQSKITAWIERNLIAADRNRQQTEGRTVLRRLNRVEYQNTINDLFAIDVDVKDLLPEDNSSHGFDNIGEALNISSVLLERYLEAADVALEAATVTGPRPKTVKGRFSYKNERRVKDHKSYKPVDDAIVFFSAGYSPTEINQFRATHSGTYRIRISAYAYQSDQPVSFRVYGAYGGAKHLAGYFDANPKPTVVELTTRIGYRETIRVVPYGTVIHKWNQAANEKGPGLAVQWVEIEGPIINKWPPESQRRLFGPQLIELINAAAIKRNRRIKPVYEVVSFASVTDAKRILQRLLPKIFRRPVSDSDLQPYRSIISAKLFEGYSFQNAIKVGLKAALCSPDFLYIAQKKTTQKKSDTSPNDAANGPLDDFQLASRLSYFLWSSMPDDELMELAKQEKLGDPVVLRQQTERLLNDTRAKSFTKNFVGQWLKLREIDFTTPDKILYPEFDELLQVSMVQETELFFDELLTHDLSVLNFVDSDFTILNERMARHYGIDNVKGQQFRRVPLARDSHRGGVLTQASVLKVTANGTNTSPVLRGVWVLDNIMGQPADPPPPNVPAVEPDIRGATSIRDQLAKHRKIQSCATCHKRIDPPGFALENFDVIGGWRTNYRSVGEGDRVNVEVNGRGVRYKKGLPIESSDVMPNGDRFQDINGFKRLLLKDKNQIARCLTEKLLTYATGSGIQFADHPDVDKIVQRLATNEFGLRFLVHQVIQSRMFREK